MDKVTMLKKAIKGELEGKVPFSFWTHLPEIDRNPELLAEETYQIFKKFDLDFIKTMNNGMYAIEDYPVEIDYSEVASGGVAKIIETPIKKDADWQKIKVLNIEEGALNRELQSLKKLLELVDGEAPVIFTVFSPLTIANKLSKNQLQDELETGNQNIHHALEEITQTTVDLAKKAIEIGASGVYFASQMGSYDLLTEELYEEYGKKYDLLVLDSVKEAWFNTLHIHGDNIMFDLFSDYPVDVINWHIYETLPELKEGQEFSQKTIMGGISRMDITNENYNSLRNQIYHSIKNLNGNHLLLTPGCGIRHPFSNETINYIKEVKTKVENFV